jgi:hypothetical protein
MAATVTISSDSTYKDTTVFSDRNGNAVHGLFNIPPELIAKNDGDRIYTLRESEVGLLDGVAATYFGPGNEKMWRVIALANGIMDPARDTYAGMRLRIPPAEIVSYFSSRAPRNG